MKKLFYPFLFVGALSILVLAGPAFYFYYMFDRAPERTEIPLLFSGSVKKIYAYEVWNGKGYMLFSKTPNYGDSNKIYFDRITRFGGIWTGWQGSIPITQEPASLGVNHCTGYSEVPPECKTVDVFGQINDPNIISLELFYYDTWHQYSVVSPGFAIRIENFNGVPSDFRWLSADGSVVFRKQ